MQPTILPREEKAPFPVIFHYSPEKENELTIEVWDMKGKPYEGYIRFDENLEVVEHDINIFLSLADFLQQQLPNPQKMVGGKTLDDFNSELILTTATNAFRALKKSIAKNPSAPENKVERFFNMIYFAMPNDCIFLNPVSHHKGEQYFMLDQNENIVMMKDSQFQDV